MNNYKTLKEAFEEMSKKEPSFKIMELSGYGYELDNPIMVKGVFQINQVIRNLGIADKQPGEYVLFNAHRVGSFTTGKFAGPVDKYELHFGVNRDGKGSHELYEMYFCAYPREGEAYSPLDLFVDNSIEDVMPPKGFKIKTKEIIKRG